MSALFYRERSGWWALALLCATTLHGAALATYFDVIPWRGWHPALPAPSTEITVASLILPEEDFARLQVGAPEATPAAPDLTPEPERPPEPQSAPPLEPDPALAPPPAVAAPPAVEAEPQPEQEPQSEATAAPAPPPPEETENPLLPETPADVGAAPVDTGLSPRPETAARPPAPPGTDAPAPGTVQGTATAQGSGTAQPAAPAPSSTDSAAATPEPQPRTDAAPPADTAPPRALADPIVAPPPPPPDAAVLRRLVSRIRDQFGESCLVALPQLGQGRAADVVLLSDRDRSMVTFSRVVLPDPEAPEADPLTSRAVLIDHRQCPALNFLRARGAYPAFGLSLGLASAQVLSGGRLVGSIEGAASGAQTALLLIDDNGVVQDLRRFLRFSGGRISFEVPVTRDGDPRDTSQLLIALSTPGRVDAITNLAGHDAAEFFGALQKELDPQAAIAVLPFDLR